MPHMPGEFRVVSDYLHLPGFGGPRVRVCYVLATGERLSVCPWGDTLEECRADYEAMGKAFEKAVLEIDRESGKPKE
jgi:hypothetical protein